MCRCRCHVATQNCQQLVLGSNLNSEVTVCISGYIRVDLATSVRQRHLSDSRIRGFGQESLSDRSRLWRHLSGFRITFVISDHVRISQARCGGRETKGSYNFMEGAKRSVLASAGWFEFFHCLKTDFYFGSKTNR